MWNAAAYRLLDVPVEVDPVAETHVAALERRWGCTVPAAVREWIVDDWRKWADRRHAGHSPTYHLLDRLHPTGPGCATPGGGP